MFSLRDDRLIIFIKMKIFFLILVYISSYNVNAQYNLTYYLSNAFQNSPILNENKNKSQVNQLEMERLKALYFSPKIGITANYMFSPILSKDNNKTSLALNSNGATNYYGYDLGASNGGRYQALVEITQPLFNRKLYEIATKQLNIASQLNENSVKISKHDIEKIVTDQYILCLQNRKEINYADTMMKLLTTQKTILEKLVMSSIYKQSDLTLLNIEYQNFLSQLTTYKANYRRNLMDLNIICGINDTTNVRIDDAELTLNNKTFVSNFLEKYRLDSLGLIAQLNVLELKYKPQLNLFANAGLNAVYAPTIPNRFGMSVGLSFTYNFYDGNQKLINRKKIQVLGTTVSFYKENFVKQNHIRKSKILTEIQSYYDRIAVAEQQLKDYESVLNSYKREFLSGQLSVINYIMVLKNMASINRDYTLLFSQQQSLINAYNYWNW